LDLGAAVRHLGGGAADTMAGRSAGGGSFGTACLIVSDRFQSVGPRAEIIARTWADKALLSGQVDMGDTEFARSFIVRSKDPASAKAAIGEGMQEALLRHTKAPLYNPVRIAVGPSGAVVLTGYQAEPERWRDLEVQWAPILLLLVLGGLALLGLLDFLTPGIVTFPHLESPLLLKGRL
jgi:hypothetical protein